MKKLLKLFLVLLLAIATSTSSFAVQVGGSSFANPSNFPGTLEALPDADLKLSSTSNVLDANNNELLTFDQAGSAVNYLEMGNSATGDNVVISARGDDADIDFLLQPKGTGAIIFESNNGNAPAEILVLTNNDETSSGEFGQTVDIVAELTGTTDNGSSYDTAVAASIQSYKTSDWYDNSGTNDDWDSGLKFYTTSGGNSTLAMSINSDQKIGIATAEAQAQIHLYGDNTMRLGFDASQSKAFLDMAVDSASEIVTFDTSFAGIGGLSIQNTSGDGISLCLGGGLTNVAGNLQVDGESTFNNSIKVRR